MPPSLRRRAQVPPPHFQFPEPVSDSDDGGDAEDIMEDAEGDVMPDEDLEVGVEDEEDEDDEEPLASPTHSSALQHSPIPPNFREISTLASWTVSSSKPGCSIPQLRHPSTALFWQSDGPQPHYLNIHFFKLVRIVGLRLFLDFEADESYTPTRIVFLAGSGGNDLQEWGEMRLEQPRGWVWADFEGVGEVESDDEEEDSEVEEAETETIPDVGGASVEDDGSDFENTQPAPTPNIGGPGDPMALDAQMQNTPLLSQQTTPTVPQLTPSVPPRTHPRRPLHNLTPNASPSIPPPRAKKAKLPVLRCHLVQIKILENHQNGKDTHLRGLQIFAKDNERESRPKVHHVVREPKSMNGNGGEANRRKSKGVAGPSASLGSGLRGLTKSSWDVEPTIR